MLCHIASRSSGQSHETLVSVMLRGGFCMLSFSPPRGAIPAEHITYFPHPKSRYIGAYTPDTSHLIKCRVLKGARAVMR